MSKVNAARKQVVDADDAQADPEDSFSPLMQRLEAAIHRLKLAADDLSDLAEPMPTVEHGSAACVVAETTEYLNRLYRDLEAWETTHDFTPKDMQPLMEYLRQIGADDETRNRMLHGRTVLSPAESPAPCAP